MLKYSKAELNRQAKELGFVRDTFEKVCRLADVLTFMESDPLLADSLSLKGGTAICPAFLWISISTFQKMSRGNLCLRRESRSMRISKSIWRLRDIHSA